MRRSLVLFVALAACAHHRVLVDASVSPPAKVPPDAATPSAAPAALAHGPGQRLRGARRELRGVVPPADWIEERPALDGIWPKEPALSLRETWTTSTVCRSASWSGGLEERVRDGDRRLMELAATATGSAERRVATSDLAGTRMRISETRERLGHEGHGGLSAPLVELSVCVDGLGPELATAAARVFLEARPSTVDVVPLLELEGVRVLVATYEVSRAEAEVDLVLTPAAQARVGEWLVARGLAVRHPTIAWAFDSTASMRSFIFYPPDREDNVVSISAR